MSKYVYGIDLGATNSRIARLIARLNDDGVPEMIPNREGTDYTPSVVFFDGNNIIAGQIAKENTILEPENTVSFVRNLMGKTDCAYTYKGRDITPEEISSYILMKVAQDASKQTGQKVKDVVITVPAYFGAAEIEATVNAGRLAGLNVLNIISEPVAAAIGYGITNQTEEKNILVYDLGGSTFDVTVLKVKSGNIKVICADGNHDLGGKNWDGRIQSYFMEQFRELSGFEWEFDSDDLQEFALKTEKAKRELTYRVSTTATFTCAGLRGTVEITRKIFDYLTKDLLDSTINLTNNTIETAKNRGINIDQILLVGGSTYMPQVAETLRSKYDVELSFFGPDVPEEAVAKGAAIYAKKLMQDMQVDNKVIFSYPLEYFIETKDVSKTDQELRMNIPGSYIHHLWTKQLILELIETRENVLRILADCIANCDANILNAFEKYGAEVIKSSYGDDYNPAIHEYDDMLATHEISLHNKIAESIRSGYKYNGKVIYREHVNVYHFIGGLTKRITENVRSSKTDYGIDLGKTNTCMDVRSSKTVYGIDLGTTNTCIARIDEHGKPEVINNKEGSNTTPSVVLFDGEDVIVGNAAKKNEIIEPENTASFVKIWMGKTDCVINYKGRDITPEEISSHILMKVARDASEITGEEVKDVVITVPSYFGAAERDATQKAGELAGLNVLDILSEPVASAYYYGVTNQEEEKNILIYDLGGGTFDVTVLNINPIKKRSILICADGDHDLGGKDWDARIREYLEELFREKTGFNGEFGLADLQDLSLKAEKVKIDLTCREMTSIGLDISGFSARIELTREKFEELTADLLDLTIAITDNAIETAKKKGVNIDQILLVGGSTRMPQVSSIIKSKYGLDPAILDPDEAVAKGAAIYARINASYAHKDNRVIYL